MKKNVSHYILHYFSNIIGAIVCVPLGFGGFYILFWMGTAAYNNDRLYHPAVLVFLAVVLMLSLLSFAGAYRAIKKMQEAEADLDSANVDTGSKPWLLNKEWREKEVTGYSFAPGEISPVIKWLGLFFLVFLPVGILLASSIYGINRNGLNGNNGTILFICLIIVIGCIYQFAKQRKFGKSICHLKTLPIRIGQHLEAEVEIGFSELRLGIPDRPDQDVETTLQCCQASRHGNPIVIEEYRKDLSKDSVIAPGDGTLVIPVFIDIPEPAEDATNIFRPGVFWRLMVKTTFRGMGYQYFFNVPVVSAKQ